MSQLTMQIGSLHIDNRSNVTILKKPKEFGHYSRTINDEIFVNDDRNLAYYYFTDDEFSKNQHIDLMEGRRHFQDRNLTIADPCSLKGLLDTIREKEVKYQRKVNADIITFRGIIRKLISFATEDLKYTDSINLQVIRFDGQIFIKEVAQSSDVVRNSSNTIQTSYGIDFGSFSGYKFETLTTIPGPLSFIDRNTIENRPKQVVTNGNEYATVVRTGVGSHKIILGAEIDAIYDFKPNQDEDDDILSHYVELKCTKQIRSERDCLTFEKKLFRTWIQCFLIGVPHIIYGFRDDQYQLKTIEEYRTEEIPDLVSPSMRGKFSDSIRWYGCLIDWLKKTISDHDNRSEISCYKLTSGEKCLKLEYISENTEEYQEMVNNSDFINPEFKEWRRSLTC